MSKIFTTKINSKDAFIFDDEIINRAIKEKYTFECAYHPEGYDVIFSCIEDNREDSRKDKWKAVFFKRKTKRNGTVTLDNIDDLKGSGEVEIVFFKEVDGNYEDMINIAVDLIKKYIVKMEQQNGE